MYINVLAEFLIRPHTLMLTCLNVCITYLMPTSYLCLAYKQYVGIRWTFFYANTKFWDLFAVWQRIPTYCKVFVTCLKLITSVFSVYQRTCTCWFSHTSTYLNVCITYQLRTSNVCLTYRSKTSAYAENVHRCTHIWTSSSYDSVYQRTIACS